jgi:hypothetical protein
MYLHAPSGISGPLFVHRFGAFETGVESETSVRPTPIRAQLVERVRREIAEGVYDTPEKLEIALDRLFSRLENPTD